MPLKVLMVDDEPDLELLVRQRLRVQVRAGELELLFGRNGEEALDRLREHPDVDVVVTDINMPVMDGLELLGHLRLLPEVRKALVVSAYDDMQNIRTAMNRGAYDFLTKPLDFQDFTATLAKTKAELDTLRLGLQAREQLASLQADLEVATRIQQSMLPPPVASGDGFDIRAAMLPARQVSGDFYDYFRLDGHRLGFAIGDVSGKGVPASLFMAVTRTLLRATALQGDAPSGCLERVNRLLHAQSDGEVYVTLLYGTLNLATGEVEFSVGGQPPPYLLPRRGPVRLLNEVRGRMLGLFEEVEYASARVTLEPGDSLFLYTDGVTEATNAGGTLFSAASLTEMLERVRQDSSEDIMPNVIAEVQAFTAGASQADDITACAVRYRPGEG